MTFHAVHRVEHILDRVHIHTNRCASRSFEQRQAAVRSAAASLNNRQNYDVGVRQCSLQMQLAPLSMHINNGETICIPFTTVRRYNHR